MEVLIELLKIFFDPMSVLFWVIVAIITVVVLRKKTEKEGK